MRNLQSLLEDVILGNVLLITTEMEGKEEKMKIFELLETAKKTGDIITRKKSRIGCTKNMRYFESYKRFMKVKENGDLILPDNPRRCEVALSEDLFDDNFYLIPYKTEEERLYGLTNKHAVTIEDLETIVEIYDNGIFTDDIVKAVLRTYPYSSYASEMSSKKANDDEISRIIDAFNAVALVNPVPLSEIKNILNRS